MFKIVLRRADRDAGVPVTLEAASPAQAHDTRMIARVGEQRLELELERGDSGAGRLRVRNRVFPVYAARDGSFVHVWLGGRVHTLEIVPQTPRRAHEAAAGPRRDVLAAPMPGTVLRVEVVPGASVAAHQALVVLESMKMELSLSVPHAARVRDVRCRPGELVALGAVLLTLEEVPDGAVAAT